MVVAVVPMPAVPVVTMPMMTAMPVGPAPSIGGTVVAVDRAVEMWPPIMPPVAVMRPVPDVTTMPVMAAVPAVTVPMGLRHKRRCGSSLDGGDGQWSGARLVQGTIGPAQYPHQNDHPRCDTHDALSPSSCPGVARWPPRCGTVLQPRQRKTAKPVNRFGHLHFVTVAGWGDVARSPIQAAQNFPARRD